MASDPTAGEGPSSVEGPVDPEIDHRIDRLLDDLAVAEDRDLLREIFLEGVRLASTDTERLDLKIVAAALREMRDAFGAFAPYRNRRKVTVFGSARTRPEDPLYQQASRVARQLAATGWMVVTGAGPGIMQAAMEGAGREQSFGVRIRLPFETEANAVIAGDDKLVSMKYFFTRKLMLMKESAAFVALPGGFGTLDETFELLTLQQTGKAEPAPTVLLDIPGGTYWHTWRRFLVDEVVALGMVSPRDVDLAHVTDDVDDTIEKLVGFYTNYHSIRWVGSRLVIRLHHDPTDADLATLNRAFGSLCADDRGIGRTEPLRPEITDADQLDLARIILTLDQHQVARLHDLIAMLNTLPSS